MNTLVVIRLRRRKSLVYRTIAAPERSLTEYRDKHLEDRCHAATHNVSVYFTTGH